MPSPVAHSLVGLALATLLPVPGLERRRRWYAFAVAASCAPDLDFLAGLAVGHVNALHGGASHSLLATLAFALVVTALLGPVWGSRAKIFTAAAAMYGSHVVLDMFCGPSPLRPGLPLLWPSSTEFLSPWRPLMSVIHGGRGGMSAFLDELFSWHNAQAVAIEAVVFMPLLWLVIRLAPRAQRPREAPVAADRPRWDD